MRRLMILGTMGLLLMTPPGMGGGTKDPPVRTDDEFLQMAASGHNAAIHFAKIAGVRAKNSSVKDFSDRLVREHQAAYDSLGALLKSRKIGIIAGLEKECREEAKRLVELNAEEFDRAFLDVVSRHHEKCIRGYESHVKSSQQSDVRDYAKKTLAVLREHHEIAQKLHKTLSQ